MIWVRIEDSEPKVGTDVLCYRENYIVGMKDVYTYKGNGIWEDFYGYCETTEDEGITYWMELPPDPIKEDF